MYDNVYKVLLTREAHWALLSRVLLIVLKNNLKKIILFILILLYFEY